MELQEILEKRQSIRHYKDGDVSEADLRKMVEAAGLAPSGKNIQNWHFVVIKNRELIEKIGRTIIDKNELISLEMDKKDKQRGDKFRKFVQSLTLFFLKAPAIAVVYTTVYRPSGYYELEFTDCHPSALYELVDRRSPGMQSLGAALENFTLKAIDLGYGTCWLTSANYAADEIEAVLKKEIGFEKEGYYMAAMMSIGVAEDNAKSPKKKALEEIYTFVE